MFRPRLLAFFRFLGFDGRHLQADISIKIIFQQAAKTLAEK